MPGTLPHLRRTIVDVLDSWSGRGAMVGSAAALVTTDGVSWADYRGMANLERGRAAGAETLWDWGSITKLICGVVVLQLRDRGRLRLEDSLLDHLPELAGLRNPVARTEDITLEHLLTHTAGLPNTFQPDPGGHEWPDWETIASGAPRIEIGAAPGAAYRYSNLGFTFLGRIVEQRTREDFEVHSWKNVLLPLGMRDSWYDRTPVHLLPRRAESYRGPGDAQGTPYGVDVDHGATTCNGGLKGSLPDLARFARFLLGGGPGTEVPVLAPATLEEMYRRRYPTASDGGVGLAFHRFDHGNRSLVGHTGAAVGFRAGLFIDPDRGVGLLMAANTDHAMPWLAETRAAFAAALDA